MVKVPKVILKELLVYLNMAPTKPDVSVLSSLLHDDIVWHFPGNGRSFGSGSYQGVGAIATLLSGIFTHLYKSETFEYEFLNFFGDDEFATAHYRVKAESVTGNQYFNEYALLARVQQDKIIELWEFLDTAYAQAKLFTPNKAP